jgi:hypothetical protein
MSTDRNSIGCVVMIAGALIIGGAIVHDSKSSNQAPVLSQPETGTVSRDSSAERESSFINNSTPPPALSPPPTPAPVLAETSYTSHAPQPLTRAQILDSNPVQSEPLPGLQGQANTFGNDAAIKLINHLPTPAYVKVVSGAGTTLATVYLRTQESYQLEIPAGSYQVKYASGSASQWRGPLYYFGSSTSFHKGNFTDIPANQILSLTFYQIVTKGYASGGAPTISAEEFER